MPLFVCERCEVVENTASARSYWRRAGERADGGEPEDWPLLCSECDTGEWHGRFPRKPYDPEKDGEIGYNRRLAR